MKTNTDIDPHADALTGETDSHPVGVGIGAATGGTVGAAIGTVVGPLGSLTGAVIGGLVGGVIGKETAEAVEPVADDVYWREAYLHEPYHDSVYTYEDYAPAYHLGYQSYAQYSDSSFVDIEDTVHRDWLEMKGSSRLPWENAKEAILAVWSRSNALIHEREAIAPPLA